MRLNHYRLRIMILSLWVLSFCSEVQGFELRVEGYSAEVQHYPAMSKENDIVVIGLHGKEKGYQHPGNVAFASQLARAGYTVYTPQMPWYGYEAPLSTSFVFLDELIRQVVQPGQRVVIAGHSQGATYALFYTTAHKPPPSVVGTILLAPGHLIHQSMRIQEATSDSVAKAHEQLMRGNDAVQLFYDYNGGGGIGLKPVRTKPSIYLSYFDLNQVPDFIEVITKINKPILWLDGRDDLLAERLGYKYIFNKVPRLENNRYQRIEGNHVSMLSKASKESISWLNGR